MQPEDFIYPNDRTRLQGLLLQFPNSQHYPRNAELKPGYLGGLFTLLSIVCIIWMVKRFKKKDYFTNGLFLASLLGFVLSLGPFLHWHRLTIHKPFPIPLPYAAFYY